MLNHILKLRVVSTLLLSFFASAFLSAQCFEPDATIWENTWASCSTSPNPNAAYGDSHWIQYDLGELRRLSKTWIWNTNDPNELDRGFRSVSIDYSTDGNEWVYWGDMEFPQAAGAAVYGGFPGPDMVGIEAQYILITANSNYGDPSCYGLAEVKFNLLPNAAGSSADGNYEDCQPITEHEVEVLSLDAVLVTWEPLDNVEDYLVEYRLEGTTEWTQVASDYVEALLENLIPLETYEYRITSVCYSELSAAVPGNFTITEDALCPNVDDLEINLLEVGATEAFLNWPLENSILQEMQVTFYPEGAPQSQWMTTTVTEPNVFLGGLAPETTYNVFLGWTCAGESFNSEPFDFTTLEENGGFCSAVGDISLETLDYTTATLSWTTNGSAEGYTVAYTLEEEDEWTVIETTEPNVTLTNLVAEEAYVVIIGVRCGENILWSDPFYFFTDPVSSTNDPFQGQRSVKTFPNPTRGALAVEYTSNRGETVQYELINALGQVQQQGQWSHPGGQQLYSLDISSAVDGIYWLRLNPVGQKTNITRRIVKI